MKLGTGNWSFNGMRLISYAPVDPDKRAAPEVASIGSPIEWQVMAEIRTGSCAISNFDKQTFAKVLTTAGIALRTNVSVLPLLGHLGETIQCHVEKGQMP